MSAPFLVSVLMATRPRFEGRARRCFERQSYPHCELIEMPGPAPLGAKLNAAAEKARGEILIKWDDDDWYSPDFILHAVGRLEGARNAIVASTRFAVLVSGETVARLSGAGWPAGGTLCFHRSLWESRGFVEELRRVDEYFRLGVPVLSLYDAEDYMIVRHDANLWAGSQWDKALRARPEWRPAADILPAEDLEYFHDGWRAAA